MMSDYNQNTDVALYTSYMAGDSSSAEDVLFKGTVLARGYFLFQTLAHCQKLHNSH